MNARADAVRRAFAGQAAACRQLGSPFMGCLLDLIAERLDPGSVVGRAVFGWAGDPMPDALALRLAGALHGLALNGTDARLAAVYPPASLDGEAVWKAVDAALSDHAPRILDWLERPPQTNVVARSAMFLPGLLVIARQTGLPLRLLEFGASAGLNLNFDRFHYDYGQASWGDPESPVRIAPRTRGPVPPLDGDLVVAKRAGCDANPLDPREPRDRLRLIAYTWPDRTERLNRQAAALVVAANGDIRVVQEDAVDWVEARLDEVEPGLCTVVLNTVVWQYLPKPKQDRIAGALHDRGASATADTPLAWLRMESVGEWGHAGLSLTLWPGGETRMLANCDWHGRWIEWLDRPAGP
jgi:hypothetical protein